MPDRGLMEPSTVEDVSFSTAERLVLDRAEWLQVTFEVERKAALAQMPCEVGRPIPPYGRLLIARSPALNVAVLSVGGRYRMMPRNVVVSVVADDPVRAAGFFGSGTTPGTVAVSRSGQQMTASVSTPEQALVSVSFAEAYAIEPTMLRWDAFVALARADGNPVISELTPAHVVESAFLTKSANVTLDIGLPRTHLWSRLRSLGIVSACYAEGTLIFNGPADQQAWS